MDFINIFIDVVKNRYADFNERARRKEFWNYVLTCVIIGVIFGVLGSILKPFSYLGLLVILALLVPGIAIAVRILHDLGKSGYFYFFVYLYFLRVCIIVIINPTNKIGVIMFNIT